MKKLTRAASWISLWLTLLAAHAETLTVATYNLQNYVSTNRLVDGVYRENYPKPEAEKQALRTVIRALDADLLAVQEMGPLPYLEELQQDLTKDGLVYPYTAWIEAEDTDRHVAIFSRKKFKRVEKFAELTHDYFGKRERVKRGLLAVTLETDAGEVTVFVVHLKSRFTDRADDPESALRRTGEAVAVRDQVLKLFPDPAKANFLLVGDFNDSRASKPLRMLSQRGQTKLGVILPAADPHGEVWSHFYRKEETYSRVDHLIVSPGLLPAIVSGSAQILALPETALASDHRPLKVTLELKNITSH